MTVEAQAVEATAQSATPYTRRARYHTSENPFVFEWPAVPVRQFSIERDRAFDAATCIGCGACVAACPNGSAMLFTAA